MQNEVQRLRDEREELHDEIAALRRGELFAVAQPAETEARPAFDMQAAIAEEMRALLAGLVADMRARVKVPPPARPTQADAEIAADVVPATEPIVLETIEDVETAPQAANTIETPVPPDEPIESIVEHVDELVRPSPPGPVFDEFVELPPLPEAETASPEQSEAVVEPVFEPAAAPEPVVEYVDEPAAPLEAIEPDATDALSPIVDEYVEDLHPAEPAATLSAADYAPADPTPELEIPTPTAAEDMDALWATVSPPPAEAAAEIAPPPTFEPNPFEMPEAVAETTASEQFAAAPEPPLELVPPPQDLVIESPFAVEPPAVEEPVVVEPRSPAIPTDALAAPKPAADRGLRQIQLLISPIHSFPRLLETERRIRSLSTVNALHLRDFRNGVATFAVTVAEAISPAEFGAVVQMLENLHLRLEGSTPSSVELRVEEEPPAS